MRHIHAIEAAVEAAERWAIHDPDPVTRGVIDALIDNRSSDLVGLFTGRIAFGTAGLRAQVGPGPNRMNALVVRQATAAVVDWLVAAQEATETARSAPRVVVGFDARHDSRAFARHAASAVAASGGVPLLADDVAPTPVFAHALLGVQADAAIVITASHNPPADNGYKLYLGDGLQLVAPADEQIAARIDELAARWHDRGPAIDDAYAEAAFATQPISHWIDAHRTDAVGALLTSHRDADIAYSAMHGVGGASVVQSFASAGFPELVLVPEQHEPDPDFPTVPFPNPEEPGAMDLVMAQASRVGADAAFANDPDADRLAVAVPARDGASFVALNGNELGVLLADHVLTYTTGTDRIVARSVVSSRLLDAMAETHTAECIVTLTGFKWIARPIVTHAPRRFVFGYEEAIGYCVGDRVRDKDGVTAALVAAEALATLKAHGKTAWDRFDELAETHGVYESQPLTVRFDDDPSQVHALMERVAGDPPTSLAGSLVNQTGAVGLGALPPTSGLHLLTEDQTQVIVRPSGTEPKIKAYLEVIEPVSEARVASARLAAKARLGQVALEIEQLLAG